MGSFVYAKYKKTYNRHQIIWFSGSFDRERLLKKSQSRTDPLLQILIFCERATLGVQCCSLGTFKHRNYAFVRRMVFFFGWIQNPRLCGGTPVSFWLTGVGQKHTWCHTVAKKTLSRTNTLQSNKIFFQISKKKYGEYTRYDLFWQQPT